MKILYIIPILVLSINSQAQIKKQEQKKVEEKRKEPHLIKDISIDTLPDNNDKINDYRHDESLSDAPESENAIYFSSGLQVQPEYPGGLSAFISSVISKIKKPKIDDSNKKLKTYLAFVIEKDGSINNVRTVRDPHNLGEEIVKAIKLLPKWTPGILDNKPVRVSFNIPLNIEAE